MVNLVTKKLLYSPDVVVGFEIFKIAQKTKKLALRYLNGHPLGVLYRCPGVPRGT